ncbi:MAG TPA: 3-methyl-2-oxobutanoate hydroxymethyltransferase [Pseudomonadales bacterium]|nr:3-methyl-2-oxobutanoate hydroxymethyltransferase [Pseudomonadales bacterium]
MTRPLSLHTLQDMRTKGEKISVITAYDATFARLASEAEIDSILVGDSLGMVLQGHTSTLPVSIPDMVYHTAAVAKGASRPFIIADMPFMSYHSEQQAMDNAALLMQAGAHCVKLEGGQWLCPTIAKLVERGVPVCAHLGLTPQSVNQLGGFKVQGRLPEQAQAILADAKAVEAAGACMMVLECIPSELAKLITDSLHIPTIGIGAGADTSGQVLVMHDLLGLNPHPARFVKNFMNGSDSVLGAFRGYRDAVKAQTFPAREHEFS